MKNLKTILLVKADELDWSVSIDGDCWEFGKYSPAGEDFTFSVNVEDVENVWREVRQYANDFDTEEHIEMWVEARRNGVSGVPSIRRLVEDADDIDEMLDELADALREVTDGYEEVKKKKKVVKWVTFSLNGKEVAAFTVKGMAPDEIKETAALLAYEKGVHRSEIVVGFR